MILLKTLDLSGLLMIIFYNLLAIADDSRFKIAAGVFYSNSDTGMDVNNPLTGKTF
ncbi:hypothetical protein [Shewanella sp.]|uniref:hypothetical protein n=1 Tax=Shewanella sp. TaxID=50422 RepID=UPI001EB4A707|nr:hypothetical protein [Shewanella sp.]NRB23734.1 hypothetical protein [Shewanella sp.]